MRDSRKIGLIDDNDSDLYTKALILYDLYFSY
jgi:hypothetical protein